MSSTRAAHGDAVRVLFSVFIIVQKETWNIQELVGLFCKWLLLFLTFMNCGGPYLTKEFLHKLCPCFAIVFAQVGVIPRARHKFDLIVVVAVYWNSRFVEWYLVIIQNSRIKKAAVPNALSCKISWSKNVNKKEKNFFLPNWQYWARWVEKQNFFHEDKLNIWENLLLFWMMLSKTSVHL